MTLSSFLMEMQWREHSRMWMSSQMKPTVKWPRLQALEAC